jgi:hypothetical protein
MSSVNIAACASRAWHRWINDQIRTTGSPKYAT